MRPRRKGRAVAVMRVALAKYHRNEDQERKAKDKEHHDQDSSPAFLISILVTA